MSRRPSAPERPSASRAPAQTSSRPADTPVTDPRATEAEPPAARASVREQAPASITSSAMGASAAGSDATGPALIASADESLLEVIDNLLSKGVLLHGEVVLGLADVDLIYVRLSVLLCAADRILPRR